MSRIDIALDHIITAGARHRKGMTFADITLDKAFLWVYSELAELVDAVNNAKFLGKARADGLEERAVVQATLKIVDRLIGLRDDEIDAEGARKLNLRWGINNA